MLSGFGGIGDFLFGEDAKAGGGNVGNDILGQLHGYYGGQLDSWGRPQPLSQSYINTLGKPTLNFQQRNPYQFNFANSYDPRQAVGDAFTPEIQRAQNILRVQGQQERENILNDLNRRGLATSGITTDALMRQQESQRNSLSDLANQLAGQQAQQQLQSAQFGAGLQSNQQQAQAAEFFRQQGATDNQAMALADELFRRQQAQGSAMMNRFNQQQMPAQNLYQLAQLSGQWNPYQAASGGALGGMVGAGMTAAGAAIGGPIGAQIGSQIGKGFNAGSQPGQVVMPQQVGGYQPPTFNPNLQFGYGGGGGGGWYGGGFP